MAIRDFVIEKHRSAVGKLTFGGKNIPPEVEI